MYTFRKIHFIGICGTLMGNAAVFFKNSGFEVRGSDKAFYPPISDLLREKNLTLYKGFDVENLAWLPDIVVIGNSISRGNPEVEYVLNNKINYISLPEMLKTHFIGNKDSIVISGTHGKTTTTSIISKIFSDAGRKPSYLIGGIPQGVDSGFKSGSGKEVILEGDEYDTAFFDKRSKFLHYKPKTLIINNIEYDHSDIYKNVDEIKTSFKRLVNLVPQNGHIIANFDDANVRDVVEKTFATVETFGKSDDCKWQIKNIEYHNDKSNFELWQNEQCEMKVECSQTGEFQIYNFTASIITSLIHSITKEKIAESIADFKGVKRRFEKRGEIGGCEIYEDFAHHPTAITHVLNELKRRYPTKKIIAVFEPRSNTTRRNIFQTELANSFAIADYSIIGKIDREELLAADDKLNTDKLIADIERAGKKAFYIKNVDEIVEKLTGLFSSQTICIIMTNGEFEGIFEKLKL